MTVTDQNGCTSVAQASVTTTNGPSISNSVVTNVTCNGGSDGGVNITVAGGTPGYTYAWSNSAATQDIYQGLLRGYIQLQLPMQTVVVLRLLIPLVSRPLSPQQVLLPMHSVTEMLTAALILHLPVVMEALLTYGALPQ